MCGTTSLSPLRAANLRSRTPGTDAEFELVGRARLDEFVNEVTGELMPMAFGRALGSLLAQQGRPDGGLRDHGNAVRLVKRMDDFSRRRGPALACIVLQRSHGTFAQSSHA